MNILHDNSQEYISVNFLKSMNRYFLNKQLPDNLKSKDILEILFSETSKTTPYSINNTNTFHTYFFEKVYNGIPMEEMNNVFNLDIDKAKLFIDRIVLENKFNYLLTYLDSKDLLKFKNKEIFEQFLDLLMYIYCKRYDAGVPYFIILNLLYEELKNKIIKTYQYNESDYIKLISKKLMGNYPYYPSNMTRGIIPGIINKEFSDEIIFTKEDVLNIAKEALDNLINYEPKIKQLHIDLLYSCIFSIDQETRIVTLDRDSCSKIKDLIIANPAGYFDNFVRLGGWTSNPDYNSVACEPFWEQIFGSRDEMNTFIDSLQPTISKICLIKNFWKLYQNNNYKAIEFEGQGDVAEKIKNNLEAEIKELDILLDIESQFDELEKDRASTPRQNDNEFYKIKYNAFLNHIENISLNIYKRITIIRKIQLIINSI